MKHYRQEEWADFVRGLAGDREPAMQKHMKACKQCGEAVAIWEQIVACAAREESYSPPESAVRISRSYAAALPPKKARSLAARVADLIEDSNLRPSFAGVRSTAAVPRQLLFRSGEYNIDLRIESQATGRNLLVGQILSSTGGSVRSIPVALISGLGPVASAVTSEFGEFSLELEAGVKVQLLVWLFGSQNILVPLHSLVSDELGKVQNPQGLRGGE